MAIVHATGSPDGTRSLRRAGLHGDRDARREEHAGRLAQSLPPRPQRTRSDPFRAVALAPQMPRSLQGLEPAPPSARLAVRHPRRTGHRHGSGIVRVEMRRRGDKVLNKTGGQAFDASHARVGRPSSIRRRTAPTIPGRLWRGAPAVAQLIKADVGLEVAFAEAGGWDTHVNQGSSAGQLATRLGDFGRGIAALARDHRRSDVRRRDPDDERVRPGGVGVATAAPITATACVMIIGGTERARRQGLRPLAGPRPRAAHDRRDLAVTTDFPASSRKWCASISA